MNNSSHVLDPVAWDLGSSRQTLTNTRLYLVLPCTRVVKVEQSQPLTSEGCKTGSKFHTLVYEIAITVVSYIVESYTYLSHFANIMYYNGSVLGLITFRLLGIK